MPQNPTYFEELRQAVANALQLPEHIVQNLIVSAVIIGIILVLRFIALRLVYRHLQDTGQHYRWKKNLTYVAGALALLTISWVWIERVQAFATILGLISAGLVFALRDTVNDMAGWVYVMTRKPFDIGDRIEIGSYKGDVVDKRILKFTLLEIGNWVEADQSTGRVLHLPNQMILNQPIHNYTAEFEFIWHEIRVMLTFESNWEKAKNQLNELIHKHTQHISSKANHQLKTAARSYMIVYQHVTPTVYTRVEDYGIVLTIRYLTNPRTRRGTEEQIWEEILRAFRHENDIEFAYPTTRMFRRSEEGAVVPGKNSGEDS